MDIPILYSAGSAQLASPYGLRPRSCEVCSSPDNLKLCTGCLVTYYCSLEREYSFELALVFFFMHSIPFLFLRLTWLHPRQDY